MIYIDQKVQMMDAGLALMNSEGSFGDAIGQVKAELAPYGKVLRVSESSGGKFDETVSPELLPESCRDCDLFVDFSSFFRKRYLSAKVESAGENKFAILVKEGSMNSPARDFLTLALAAYGFIVLLMGVGIIRKIIGIGILLLGIYLWALPSNKSILNAKQIVKTLTR